MILKVIILAFLLSVCAAEPIQIVPLDGNCPPEGVFASPHKTACDAYYKCENGTYSEEVCPNGLLFAGHPSVYDFCNYNWAVDCGDRTDIPGPIASPGCPWQFGLYQSESCTQFIKCEWGQPILTDCEPGLAYEDSIHKCNWPDEVPGCDPEAIIGFKCPDKTTGLSARFDPFPRFPYPPDCTRLITCVNKKPRLIGCGEGSAFNPDHFGCDDIKNVPGCKAAYYNKK